MAIGEEQEPGNAGNASRRGGGSELAGAGLQFGLAIIVFTLAGVWLDGKLGTSPLLVLVGAAIGAGAGFYSMYRKLIGGGKTKR